MNQQEMIQMRQMLESCPDYKPEMTDEEVLSLFHSWSTSILTASTEAVRCVLLEATRIINQMATGIATLAETARASRAPVSPKVASAAHRRPQQPRPPAR